jgi:hypothetical protein
MPNEPTSAATNWLPWIAVAVLAFIVMSDRPKAPEPGPGPSPITIEQATKSILPSIKAANAKIFEDAASKVESKEITTDKQLYEFVQPATKAARESANRPFDVSLDLSLPRNDDGTFAGKELEVATLLRKIAKSW